MENKQEDTKNTPKVNLSLKKNLFSRTLVALVLIIIIIPCAILGDYVYLALIFCLSAICCHEVIMAPQSINHRYKSIIYIFAYLMMFSLVFWLILKDNLDYFLESQRLGTEFIFDLKRGFDSPQISIMAFFISILFFFLMVMLDKNFTINDAFYFITMLFVVSFGFQCILFLRYFPFVDAAKAGMDSTTDNFKYLTSALLVIFVVAADCLFDVGAYLVGSMLGKHKMCPRISPKKTWEGFIGGFIFSVVFSCLTGYLLAYFGHPLLSFFDLAHWWNILILALVIPFTATFGDLIFSTVKRNFQIKDFGFILKSHGGMLDRVDSIIFSCIAASLLLVAMSNNWLIFL